MRSIVLLLFEHDKRVLLAGTALYVVNVILFSLVGKDAMCWHSFGNAIRICTAYLMGRESPRLLTSTGSLPIYTELLGWLLCIFGWFLVPLFVGKLVYYANKTRESKRILRLAALNIATRMGLSEENASKFADAAVQDELYKES
ncbi:MAG TPA: hypothetical protein VG759_22225 [Candidatus Angelobacter sp.]|jgi:hypothetical protein|nr:hypothetical protein [Candidatus Angelobacter sp.]